MSVFFLVILGALLLDYGLELTTSLLNLKALRLEVPAPLQGIYEPAVYRKAQEYVRASTRSSLVTSTYSLLLLLVFWFVGGFNYLDILVRGWGLPDLANGLLYLGVLFFGYSLLTLPFSIYDTFVIEQRFGFNHTSRRTFVQDRLKGLALAIFLGGLLLGFVLALFQYGGPNSWLFCRAVVTAYNIINEYTAPVWIMSLFNKFTPMGPGELKDAILTYTRSIGFPIRDVYVVDASRRSSKANAFFTGLGRGKRIALFDTLIANHTIPETVAILAHEVGHYKLKHIFQGTAVSILHTGLLFWLLSIFLQSPGLYQAFHMTHQSVYTGILFFGLLYTPLELILSIFMRLLSRHNEAAADLFAARTIDDADSLSAALKKLAAVNLSNLRPHPLHVFLNYSHPPLLSRILAITKVKASPGVRATS
jgi:STE24 endopeptidase